MATLNQVLDRPKSKELFEALCKVIPGGVNSTARAFKNLDMLPLLVEKAHGDTIIDPDGNAYIDYVCGFGAIILGHANQAVKEAVIQQLENGWCFVNSHALELELAKLICQLVPSIQSLRLVSSGTEATMNAIRLARAYSERNLLVKFNGHYHGASDALLVKAGSGVNFLSSESSTKGVAQQDTISLPFNDCYTLQAFFEERGSEVGAVIIEPVAGNMGCVPSSHEFLQLLRNLCDEYGAVLIFDEVMSGFRVGLSCAQGHYGITPDLTCLGKVIGGGLPCAGFGGRREIMEQLTPVGEVYQAGTLSGNPLAVASGIATLKTLIKPGVFDEIVCKTRMITDAVKDLVPTNQMGAMFTCFVEPKKFKSFFMHMLERGIYIPQSPFESSFVSLAHTTEHLEKTREAIIEFMEDA